MEKKINLSFNATNGKKLCNDEGRIMEGVKYE